MCFVGKTKHWLSDGIFLRRVRAEDREVQQIPGDRNAQLHCRILLLLKLPLARVAALANIAACADQHTHGPFHAGGSTPTLWVSWSGELLLCLGWVRTVDLGPSWLLEVPTDPGLLRSPASLLITNLSDHTARTSQYFPSLIISLKIESIICVIS